ncbi:MAG: S-layer homology domain-containing protein [Eubacteriales bacterium]|nr:S-layer homology domain-containing protein [Eubacteriales bacterium]
MKKQVVSACLASTMLVGSMTSTAMAIDVKKLTDIKTTDWFYPSVEYVAKKDYMIGVSSDRFAPQSEMTRAMFVTVLARLEGVKAEDGESKFKDVPADKWYTQAVNWATANGIVQGTGADMFLPDNFMTRQDMCAMLARYVEYHEKKHNVSHVKKGKEIAFTDKAQISKYAAEPVEKCVRWGLIVGNKSGTFAPLQSATRAEVAAVISRLAWESNAIGGGSTGGGGGGGGTVAEKHDYTVKASIEVPESLPIREKKFEFTEVKYENVQKGDSDQEFNKVVRDLVANEDNKTPLTNAINEALKKVKNTTKTVEVKGQTITVTVSEGGVISATTTVPVNELIKNQPAPRSVIVRAATSQVSQKQIEELIQKLQEGGENVTFTTADTDVFEALQDKITDVIKMDPEKLEAKVQDALVDRPDLKPFAEGMKADEIKAAATEYQEKVTAVQTQVEDKIAEAKKDAEAKGEEWTGTVSVPIDEPAVMTVSVNLSEYIKQANEKRDEKKETAIQKLENQLGFELKEKSKAEAERLYETYTDPEKYVDVVEENLQLKTADAYYQLLIDAVTDSANFVYKLTGDNALKQAYYEDKINALLAKAEGRDGIKVTFGDDNVLDVSSILADQDSMFMNDEGYLGDKTIKFTVDVKEAIWDTLGLGDKLGAMPDVLNDLMGSYTVTVTIDDSAM